MTYDLDKNRPLQSWKSGLVDGRVDLAADAESINRADQHGMALGLDAIVHGLLRHRAAAEAFRDGSRDNLLTIPQPVGRGAGSPWVKGVVAQP
jgi:hypothetical protein